MWEEVLRVSKPGATLFCFGGTRTYHRVACAIEDAGWQLKDSLMWIYGSGFPESTDISKALDKEAGKNNKREIIVSDCSANNESTTVRYGRCATCGKYIFSGNPCKCPKPEPATDIAKQWTGYGTALKPSFEPIMLAMKPLEKGLTYAQNARKWGVAGLNIDAGRISTNDKLQKLNGSFSFSGTGGANETGKKIEFVDSGKGRWPANVILSHSPDCVQVGTQQINEGAPEGGYSYEGKEYKVEGFVKDCKPKAPSNRGQETIDVYACVPDCPIRIMDTQSGKLQSSFRENDSKSGTQFSAGDLGKQRVDMRGHGHNDSGGSSRFFYCAKSSRSERESGLKDFIPCVKCGEIGTEFHFSNSTKENCIRNGHPTVKPIAIMEYLCKLIKMPALTKEQIEQGMRPQIILDPFCGSGSTLLAANEVGLKYIGIDMGIDNVMITSSRSLDDPPDELLKDEKLSDMRINPIDVASNAQQLSSDNFSDLLI